LVEQANIDSTQDGKHTTITKLSLPILDASSFIQAIQARQGRLCVQSRHILIKTHQKNPDSQPKAAIPQKK